MKPCQRFKESIFQLFDETLDIRGRKELEHHLKTCAPCSRFLDRMRSLRSHLRALPPIEVSENFHILVRERIRRDMARTGGRHSTVSISRRLIPVFGLTVLLVMVSIWTLDRRSIPVNTLGNPIGEYRSASPHNRGFDGQIQYVIDEYPNTISVSRQDIGRIPRRTPGDSVLLNENVDRLRNRLTPVSF